MQFRDSTDPERRAKPIGVIGCELWASTGAAFATDPAQCSFVGMFTRTPLQMPTGAEGGKKVTVFARWVNRSGPGGHSATGPWSTPLQAFSL
jgi:hypothetical protein